jgi:hypothetical protein
MGYVFVFNSIFAVFIKTALVKMKEEIIIYMGKFYIMKLKVNYRKFFLFCYATLLFFFILYYYGLIQSNYIYHLNVFIFTSSIVENISNHGGFFQYIINSIKNPVIGQIHHGVFFYFIMYFFYFVFKNSYLSLVLTNTLFILISFYSTYYLLNRKFNIGNFISITFSFFFLLQPFIKAHISSYGVIGINLALIPLYILIDIIIFEVVYNSKKFILILFCFFAFFITKLFALFMNGYGFVISSISSGCFFLFFLIKNIKEKKYYNSIFLGLLFFISYILTYFLYSSYIGKSEYNVMDINFFRAMGVDLVTLFLPHKSLFLIFRNLNIGVLYNPLAFYSDGSSVYFNYIGYFILITSILSFLFFKKKREYFYVIMAASLISFVLSLGPSIKFNNQRNIENIEVIGNITSEDYLMPKDKALFSLNMDFVFTKIPGIKNMRSIYRFLVLFKFFLLLSSAIFIDNLLRDKKFNKIGYFLLIMIFFEYFPNLPYYFDKYYQRYTFYKNIEKDLISELKKYLIKKEVIFFLSQENDFMADYISSRLDIETYNKGGDKRIELIYKYLPYTIKKLREYSNYKVEDIILFIKKGFDENLYDALIFPYFNMRWASYYWPPEKDYIDNEKIKFEPILKYFEKNSDYILIKSEFFSLLRLKNKKVKENISNFTVFYDFYDNFKKAKIVGNNNAKGLNPWGKRVTILPVLFRTKKMIYSMNGMNILYKVKFNNLSNAILYFYTKLGPHPEIKDFKSKNGTYLCDGFRMKVNILENNNTYEILNKYIYPDDEEQEYFLDISDYKNKTFNFEFSVENDKGKNNMSDWALWINPRLILTTNKIPYSRKIVLANKVQDLKFLSPIIDFSKSSFDNQLGRGWYRYEDYFRWIGKEAEAILKNPDTNSTNFKLIIKGWAKVSQYFIKNVKLSVYLNGEKIKETKITKDGEFTVECGVNKKLQENVYVKIEVNKTFVPKNGDTRNLGIIIKSLELVKD